MAQAKTEQEYAERNKRLIAMGLKPLYSSLKEERKAVRAMNKLAREMGFGAGIDQVVKENKKSW